MTKKGSPNTAYIIPVERLVRQIYLMRGQKVMLDSDLAELYDVPTKVFNQAVKRNLDRFPEDFMFQLTKEELANWRSQIVTSNPAAKMGLRRRPYAFTEQGVAMLSSVLHSDRAVQMNILIIRTFVKLRELLATHKDLAARIEKIEAAQVRHASVIELLANEIDSMKDLPPEPEKERIGFTSGRK
ncbi:MAG: ORF6N domain-containing protein [Acidobacteria bacterium]|nr:ORF6N domain-containing protein [Acidobacteriota bacterium]